MTTIVYRDGVMASDSRAFAGYNAAWGKKSKIRRMDDGTLVGVSANVPGLGEAIIDWYAAGAIFADAPKTTDAKFTLLAVKPSGEAFLASDSFFLSGPITAPFFAIGTGEGAAHGAMHMGASAVQAVEIACRIDVWSALPGNVIKHA